MTSDPFDPWPVAGEHIGAFMNIQEETTRRTAQVEAILKRYLPEETGLQKTVIEAMNYSFLAGGKRLRPLMMQETYRLFGGTEDVVEPFMAAIEMIHTYSLIHDDLPAMDNDKYRRGRLTAHAKYGEAMAILAGDGLLNLAFETALLAQVRAPGDPNVSEALQLLTHASGIYGMVGGQAADIESEGQPLGEEELDFIYSLKTGALFGAAMTIGATLAGADEAQRNAIARIAQEVGFAFQIRDDILDVVGEADELGKPIGSDEKNEKTTYVTLHGLDAATKEVERLSAHAMDVLHALPVQNEFLNELIESLITRTK